MKISRGGVLISVLPGLLMLGLFYSLAVHMRQSLGAWPLAIGEQGFPSSLQIHTAIAVNVFAVLFITAFFVLPLTTLVCFLVERWKKLVPYFALYVLTFLACWGLMQFAPEQFLYWWRD